MSPSSKYGSHSTEEAQNCFLWNHSEPFKNVFTVSFYPDIYLICIKNVKKTLISGQAEKWWSTPVSGVNTAFAKHKVCLCNGFFQNTWPPHKSTVATRLTNPVLVLDILHYWSSQSTHSLSSVVSSYHSHCDGCIGEQRGVSSLACRLGGTTNLSISTWPALPPELNSFA